MISVLDFGAVNDGVTDNRVAFEAAIAAARRTSNVVYVPPGQYRVELTRKIGRKK